jgi:plasmid stabilization system protein ParE
MKVVLSPRARRELNGQLQYLIEHDAAPAARRLHNRVMSFLKATLGRHPGLGLSIEHRDLHEVWIPRTKLVIWYRIKPDAIEVARVWHTSQDRQLAP